MKRFALAFGLVVVLISSACASPRAASRTYGVDSAGNVSGQTRSALNGSTAGGPQELVGVYLPFGPFAVKAGLEWDGTTFVPPISFAEQPSYAAAAPAGACATTRTVMVPETEWVTETRQVPRTKMVPRQIPAAAVPIPAEAAPCAPPPAAAPKSACPAPPEPVAVAAPSPPDCEVTITVCPADGCKDGACAIPAQVAKK